MSVALTSGSARGWLDVLVPVGTFILGYLLSFLGGWRDRRRARKNLETVLLYELGANHRILARYAPLAAHGGSGMRLIGRGANLSTDVQRTYLLRMDSLTPGGLRAVLDAYTEVDALRRLAANALDDVKNNRRMVIPAFEKSWPRALSKCETAIRALHGGKALLKQMTDEEAERIREGKARAEEKKEDGDGGSA